MVSIALCTYNGEKYLEEQLDCIFGQNKLPDEIIVCDDGSSDRTLEILHTYQQKHPNIFKIFRNEKNLGFIKNFEQAIHLCSKDVIIICDQDDLWSKEKISTILDFFTENPQFEGVFHDLDILEENGAKQSYLEFKEISYESLLHEINDANLFVRTIAQGSFVLGCSLAIKKSALARYHLSDFEIAHDYFIAQKLSIKNKLGFIPLRLASYRKHDEQVCGFKYVSQSTPAKQQTAEQIFFRDKVWIYLQALKRVQELYPYENHKKSKLYSRFIANRNTYLKMLSFKERKIYVAKCVRHKYLDLTLADLLLI